MVDEVITKQELIDAQKDAKTLEDVINGAADTQVTARLGRTFWTLATLNSKLNSVETAATQAIASMNLKVVGVETAATQGLININNDVASVEAARVAAESQMNAKVASVEQIFDDKLSEWDGEAQNTINEWQDAINTITVNDGVPALAVSDESGKNQHEINAEVISASRFSSLEAADAEAFRRNKPLILRDQTFTLTRDTIIASETFIESSALIDLNGFTLTFNRDVHAGEYQIFIGSTKVTGNKISKAYSDWFAPAADGYILDPLTADEVNNTYEYNGVTYPYGVAPDVTFTDDTAKLQQLIDINAKETVITDRGVYMIDTHGNQPYQNSRGGLRFRDKTKQILRVEGVLKGIRGTKVNGNLIRWYNNHHCTMLGKNGVHLIGDLFEHTLAPFDEGGMGVYIAGSTWCVFANFEARLCTGDGATLTFPRTGVGSIELEHIYFKNVKGNYCRRTGHVIEIGDYIHHDKCQWNNNGLHINGGHGTWSGVDIEPLSYADTPVRYASNVFFNECEANDNRGAGLRLEKLLSGKVTGCTTKRNNIGIAAIQAGHGNENITSANDRIYYESNVIIEGNFIEENFSAGIASDIQRPSRVTIANNYFHRNRTDISGRFIDSIIHDNTFRETRRFWLYLTEAKDVLIHHNKVIDMVGSSEVTDGKVVINLYNEMGGVHEIFVKNGGTGYSSNPTITISGGSGGGATAVAKVVGGVIDSVYMSQTGKSYLSNPTVTVTDATGTGAELIAYYRPSVDNLTIEDNEIYLRAPMDATQRGINVPRWLARVGWTSRNVKWLNNYVDPRQYASTLINKPTDGTLTADVLVRNTKADLSRPQKLHKNDVILSDSYPFGQAIVLTEGSLPYGLLWATTTPYKVGDIIRTTEGRMYACITAGISGATEPVLETAGVNNGTAIFAFKEKAFTVKEITYV